MVTTTVKFVSRFFKSFMPAITLLLCGTLVEIHVDTGGQQARHTPTSLPLQPNFALLRHGSNRYVGPILLSFRSARDLRRAIGEVKHSLRELAEPKAARVDQAAFDKWRAAHPKLFTGKIGRFNRHTVSLHINPSIEPVQEKFRQVAFRLREPVARELTNMLDQDLIEPAEGPTSWVSAICPVRKLNGDVRITIDVRAANKAIQRSRQIVPTIDNLVVHMNNAHFISKIDLKAGYNQLVIAPECRYINKFCIKS